MVAGDGCPIDCVVADFISGAVEQMILAQQHHDILVIEGQGSLVHPSYSGVTLGLLHGALPQAMVLCYEVGRTHVTGIDHLEIPSLARIRQLNEALVSVHQPAQVIGVAINSRRVDAQAAAAERARVEEELGLPACDVVRDGPERLVDAIAAFHKSGTWLRSD